MAKKAFGGIPAFDDKAEPIFQRLGGKAVPKELAKEFEAGRIYQTIARKILDNSFDTPAGRKLLEQFIQKYPAGVYTEAAKACLDKKAQDKENKENLDPTTYFRAKGDGNELDKHSYYRD